MWITGRSKKTLVNFGIIVYNKKVIILRVARFKPRYSEERNLNV